MGKFKLVISAEILKELSSVLFLPRLRIDSNDIKELFRMIKLKALRIKPQIRLVDVCRDPKDNFILELALEAKADLVVTGDGDLLELSPFRGIPIITPKEFIGRLGRQSFTSSLSAAPEAELRGASGAAVAIDQSLEKEH